MENQKSSFGLFFFLTQSINKIPFSSSPFPNPLSRCPKPGLGKVKPFLRENPCTSLRFHRLLRFLPALTPPVPGYPWKRNLFLPWQCRPRQGEFSRNPRNLWNRCQFHKNPPGLGQPAEMGKVGERFLGFVGKRNILWSQTPLKRWPEER